MNWENGKRDKSTMYAITVLLYEYEMLVGLCLPAHVHHQMSPRTFIPGSATGARCILGKRETQTRT